MFEIFWKIEMSYNVYVISLNNTDYLITTYNEVKVAVFFWIFKNQNQNQKPYIQVSLTQWKTIEISLLKSRKTIVSINPISLKHVNERYLTPIEMALKYLYYFLYVELYLYDIIETILVL